MNEIQLSEYGRSSVVPSPVNRMMTDFASDFRDGVDINLGVGYVNEETIPAGAIRQALAEVLRRPQTYRQPLNYGGSAGTSSLIAAIRRYLLDAGIGLTEELLAPRRIIIGPNGATSLLESVACVLPVGIVVTSDPMYYIYTDLLERRGFSLLAILEDDDGIRTDVLEERLRDLGPRAADVQAFYVVTVNNPSCAILSDARRRELIRIAWDLSQRLGRKVPVILDRAYEDLVHDPAVARPVSGLAYDPGGVVFEIGTLSKVLAPGLRIGYLVGSDGPFLRAMIQRTSDAGFSAAVVTQEISSWLLDHHIRAQLERVRAGYREKATAVRGWLNEYLADDLACVRGGQAGFYLYLTFRTMETHERSAFFRYLTRTTGVEAVDGAPGDRKPRVIYIPGEFCVNARGSLADAGRRQLRLSYGYEKLDALHNAIRLMKEAADYAQRAR